MSAKNVIAMGGVEVQFRLDERDTNGEMTLFECRIAAGAKVPVPHYHLHFDETIVGLEGIGTFTVGGKQIQIGPGDSCFIPRGVVHGFENKTDSMIRFLAIVTPGVFGPEYFVEIAEVINAGGPPDMMKMMAVLQRHGLVPAVSN
jgi:quercetin dioxygenase-like cupin family protein